MLNKDLINHRFPGGSFFLNKEMNDLIMSSTGLEDGKELIDKDLGHPIFSMIALNSIGYTPVSYTHLTLPTSDLV